MNVEIAENKEPRR